MRFTQASTKYGIPKGTLYDNILGKSKRMMVLEEAGLNPSDELAVLEFCCDTSIHPYNRRTKKSLNTILNFVEKIRRERDPNFMFTGLSGFRWWWAFCKKHSIVSLYFNDENEHEWPFKKVTLLPFYNEEKTFQPNNKKLSKLWKIILTQKRTKISKQLKNPKHSK